MAGKTAAKEAKETTAPAGGKRRLILLGGAAVLVLGAGGGAAAFLLGLPPFGRAAPQEAAAAPPVFVEVPDIVANLSSAARRPVFVRLKSRLEVARAQDVPAVQAAMPRLLDMFTTYLRETRPEELRGSAGTQRLREELIARANIATRQGAVSDVLFVELVIQ